VSNLERKSCYDCKFYNVKECVCMYDCECICILDEDESAKECPHFLKGEYNEDWLEKTNYTGEISTDNNQEPNTVNTTVHPSMLVRQDLFDKLINVQVALYKQIETKRDTEGAIITKEEADFYNVFTEYAKELTVVAKKQL